MKPPKLSIIVPVYNSEGPIQKMTGSILEQDFTDFELIVVNDGSSDNTGEILEKLAEDDSRIILINQRNKGPSGARNTGLTKASGDFILFCDADDVLAKNALSTMLSASESTNADLVVSGWQIDLQTKHGLIINYSQGQPTPRTVTGSEIEIKKQVVRSIGSSGELYNLWNKLFRRNIIRKYGLKFREDLSFGEDLLFILSYIKHSSSLKFISSVTYKYLSGGSSSVFGQSSLQPKYRQINSDGLDAYIGETTDEELNSLVYWVKWRWILSYYLLTLNANMPVRKKWQNFKQLPTERPVNKISAKFLGLQKYFLATMLTTVSHSPLLLYLFVSVINAVKKTIIFTSMTIRKVDGRQSTDISAVLND